MMNVWLLLVISRSWPDVWWEAAQELQKKTLPTGGSVAADVGSQAGSEFEENDDDVDVGDGVDEYDDHDDHLAGVGVQFQVAMGIKREIAVWRGQGQTGGTK